MPKPPHTTTETPYHGRTPETLGDLISAYKQATGKSDQDLANESGMHHKWWQARRHNRPPIRAYPDLSTIRAISATLHVTIPDLVNLLGAQFFPDAYLPHRRSLLLSLLPAGTDRIPEERAYALAALIRTDVAQATRLAELTATEVLATRPGSSLPVRSRARRVV